MQPGFGTQGSPRPQGDDHLPSVQVPMSTTDLPAPLGFGQDLPKVAERCQPEQALPGVLTAEELGAHREVDPVQLPEGTTMNPSQLPGFVDLQWLDNLPFPDPLPTFAPPTPTPDPWMLMASITTWMETQQQLLRVIIPLVERLNQPPRPIVSTKGTQTPTRRTADAASQTRMTHAPKAKRRLSTNDEERMPPPPAPKKTRIRETPTTVILLDEDERPPPRYTTEPLESWRSTRGWKRPPGQRSKPKDPVFPTVDEILGDIHGTGKGRALDETRDWD